MTNENNRMPNYSEFEKAELARLGDSEMPEAVGYGDDCLEMLFRVSTPQAARSTHLLHVPKLSRNPFSVGAAVNRGNTVKFRVIGCLITS